MRTLVVTSNKARCKIIGRVLKKANNRDYTFEFFIERAFTRIVNEDIELIIVDIESSSYRNEKIELLRSLLTDLMFAEIFPTIFILSKEALPEEWIPIENCYYVSNEIELKHRLNCLETQR